MYGTVHVLTCTTVPTRYRIVKFEIKTQAVY